MFAAANAIDGALDGSGRVREIPFLGRRFNDQLRELSLQAVAAQQWRETHAAKSA